MANRSIPSGFLKTTLHNGVGRYVCQLKRITLRFCKEQAQSKGMRDFIERQLADFSRQNPGVAVYAQVRRHKSPKMFGEYVNGKTQEILVANKDWAEIAEWLDWLRTRCGDDLYKIRKTQHTFSPSIQGTWSPVTHKPSQLNVTDFPDLNLSTAHKFRPTATEILQRSATRHRGKQS